MRILQCFSSALIFFALNISAAAVAFDIQQIDASSVLCIPVGPEENRAFIGYAATLGGYAGYIAATCYIDPVDKHREYRVYTCWASSGKMLDEIRDDQLNIFKVLEQHYQNHNAELLIVEQTTVPEDWYGPVYIHTPMRNEGLEKFALVELYSDIACS